MAWIAAVIGKVGAVAKGVAASKAGQAAGNLLQNSPKAGEESADISVLKDLQKKMDKGFYGHMKVKGTKQDKSKWSRL